MSADLGHSFEIIEVPGAQALETLQRLREDGHSVGFSPILVGNRKDAEHIPGLSAPPAAEKREECLRLANDLDPIGILEANALSEERSPDESGEFDPNAGGQPGISAHLELTKKAQPKDKVILVKIPVRDSWQIPAWLNLGGWNECPEASVMTALCKSWHERYGAEIVALTGDTVEFQVARPPETEEACRALAREHYLFCPDVVEQGFENMGALASSLYKASTWFFWWD